MIWASHYAPRASLLRDAGCQHLKAQDGIEHSQTNTLGKLIELGHIVCQKDQHRMVSDPPFS